MKSKQINFYIVPEDILEINRFLKEKGCLIINGTAAGRESVSIYNIVDNKENIFQVYLCKEEHKSEISFKALESKSYYIDILKSYCIEFGIGGFYPYSDSELHRSRFYFIFEYFENGIVIKKDEEFIKWADDIFKSFKKKFLVRTASLPKLLMSKDSIRWANSNNAKLAGGGMKFICDGSISSNS